LKQNIFSLRVAINRQARVLLIAKKDIKPEEILYYDYNAGGLN